MIGCLNVNVDNLQTTNGHYGNCLVTYRINELTAYYPDLIGRGVMFGLSNYDIFRTLFILADIIPPGALNGQLPVDVVDTLLDTLGYLKDKSPIVLEEHRNRPMNAGEFGIIDADFQVFGDSMINLAFDIRRQAPPNWIAFDFKEQSGNMLAVTVSIVPNGVQYDRY